MKISKIEVSLIDKMGSDLSVANAARVSFDKVGTLEPDGSLSEKDAKLIGYLAKHDHWSPFAHTSLQFRVKAPIFVARQLVKHQVGGVWNEVSRRYVDSPPEFYFPEAWRVRPSGSMKQGSGGEHPASNAWTISAGINLQQIVQLYEAMVKDGVAPEQARMVLPQNMMTEWIWTGSLVFWARVCKLRLDRSHAQAETAEVAELIDKAIKDAGLFQHSWAWLQPINLDPKEDEDEH